MVDVDALRGISVRWCGFRCHISDVLEGVRIADLELLYSTVFKIFILNFMNHQ